MPIAHFLPILPLISIKFFPSVNSPPTCSSFYSLYKFILLVIVFVISLFTPPKISSVKYQNICCFINSFHPYGDLNGSKIK